MFDSSWNSAAFQRFCAIIIVRNGDNGRFVLANAESGDVCPVTFETKEQAEYYRRELYDNQ